MTHQWMFKRRAIAGATLIGCFCYGSAHAGTATGAATEWTQLLNNSELVSLVGQSGEQVRNQITQITQLAEQIENQLKIYENMLQNTAQLPAHIWGEIEGDLTRLRGVVEQGHGIAFSMGNADDLLRARFKSYAALKTDLADGISYSDVYQTWSDTNRDTISGTLNAASLTAEQFDSEEDTMRQLRTMSQSADGQMKALQVGHEIAAEQVGQMQKLRGLISQQVTMTGTWLQAEQSDRDLAQARRERFFHSTPPSNTGGERMKIEW
jgi:type IV secretion system protein TrbJ